MKWKPLHQSDSFQLWGAKSLTGASIKCNQKKSLYFIYDGLYWERRTCVIRSPSCWFEPRSTSTCKRTCSMDSYDFGKVTVKLHQELYSLWSQLTEASKSPSRKASSGDLGKKGSLDLFTLLYHTPLFQQTTCSGFLDNTKLAHCCAIFLWCN